MATERTNKATGIGFAPALKAGLMFLVITGSAVGYVWQKGEIDRLSDQIRAGEAQLAKVTRSNQHLADQIATLHSPVMLDQRVKELNLGLVPLVPGQVVRLVEPAEPPRAETKASRWLAQRVND